MDRTHRLGQTKQVTVYRLICKDTIEERMLQRAREKCEVCRAVLTKVVVAFPAAVPRVWIKLVRTCYGRDEGSAWA